ncbi:MAG: oligosaccharide flippase family protein [Firmicutes bacterium]|nr:oligosaccharide flippase family protein [Bacillota bacterium]
MKLERTKNAARNIVFDGTMEIVNMLFPFVIRSVMLHYLGTEYLGLNGLFKSLLSFLNLAELGVGSAMVFSMYRPIAEEDTPAICALLRLYRTLYRIIGLIVAVMGFALMPVLRSLIKSDIPPDMNLYILFLMNLGNTVLTYWLFAYKSSLLQAHQRRDVISKVSLIVRVTEYTLKILILIYTRNYYLYLTVQLLSQIIINLLTAVCAQKMYPMYVPEGKLPKDKTLDIFCRVRDLFTSKLSATVFDAADTVVISAFMGLTVLALYQNYYFIITALRMMLVVFLNACMAGVGNKLVMESKKANYRDLEKISLLFLWVLNVSSCMLLCLYQPFIKLWMGEENMLAVGLVFCFVVYYYSMGANKLINMFKDAAGIWRVDRWRPLTAAFANLSLNLLTVRWIGLYGVLISSIVSIVFIQIPWLFRNLFREVYPRESMGKYIKLFCGMSALALISCMASWFVCGLFSVNVWAALFVNAAPSFVVPNIFFFALYGRNPVFRDSLSQLKRTLLSRGGGAKKAE